MTFRAGLAVGFLAVGLSGCAWFDSHPKVGTDAGKLLSCVTTELAKDAVAGDTLVTIGFDVGVACGPDALAVLEDALAKPEVASNAKSRGQVILAARRHP